MTLTEAPSTAAAAPAPAAVPPAATTAATAATTAGTAGTGGTARLPRWLRERGAQLVRYASVSLVSTAVGLTVLGVLVASGAATPGWANIAATAVGTVPSFELNRRWVWRRRHARSLTREVGPFAVLSFVGLVVSTVAVSVAGHLTIGLGTTPRTALVEAANVGAFGSLWVLQFLLLDRVLFARGASEG
ncbi:MAG TPA: GtrA family protein [Acidimicrobiales bacterium]|nr:GtrA family protein [Acidimicrobiales bacterium]